MVDFDVVSVDMFQTLVDIASRRHAFWKTLLQESYSEERAEKYWALGSRAILGCYHRLTRDGGAFQTLKAIFELAFSSLFAEINLDLDPRHAAYLFAAEHRQASPYEDTDVFIRSVGEVFPMCLVTDADDDMLSPLFLARFRFDRVLNSESQRAYKNDPEGRLFRSVVEHYGVPPERILHVGDSSADVLGGRRVGMRVCWLNRNAEPWHGGAEPDWTARTLCEVASILGVRQEPG
jgi:putative hydrolase of the HAD superfamily